MPISIYPPTLKSTQSVFLASSNSYSIYFTLQSVTSFSEIGHVQIRLVRQSNNKSIVNTSLYPDGIIYKNASSINTSDSPTYSVAISVSELSEKWQAGYLYKVQMRFGTNSIFTSVSNFATWKQTQIDSSAFSEWSTVMVIKAIDTPDIYIKNSGSVKQDIISSEEIETSLTPTFYGYCSIDSGSKEAIEKYQFSLYSGDEVDEDNLTEQSGWLSHDSNIDTLDSYRFKNVLTNNEYYTVTYEIYTANGYEAIAESYTFQVVLSQLNVLDDITIWVESDTAYCKENGCINFYGSSDNYLIGNYIIIRSDETSNYNIWEDLIYLTYPRKKWDGSIVYQDFTIESGIRYKYALQFENSAGLRTSPLYPASNASHKVDFEYSYIYRDGIQLRLQFNQEMSSFKHTTLRSKQDTLGDKYPHLVQNGSAYYAEFPIGGLISFHMDSDQTFFTKGSDGYYYNGELVIPAERFIEDGSNRLSSGAGTAANLLTLGMDTSDDSVFVERIFREKAEAFLNDFEYKLYRSPTEGNMIIGILSVSLTPKTELGRMIFSFSGTAYEVMENTLENLDEVGIIDMGEISFDLVADKEMSFGQISRLYGSNIDILSQIREQEEISLGNGYAFSLTKVTRLWVEFYPLVSHSGELSELTAERAEMIDNGEDTTEVDAEIAELEALVAALSGPTATIARISVNGAEVVILPNKVYSLRQDVTELSLIQATAPIIVNYVCELVQVADPNENVISTIDVSRIWGQISGVFTGTDSVLKVYDYDYADADTYRVYNPNGDDTIIYDTNGNIVVDSTNYNVYKTVNIYDIIKEEARKQIEVIYGTTFTYSDDYWNDGTIYYEFNDITLFDIEADAGTHLILSRNSSGSDPVDVYIGKTGKVIVRHVYESDQDSGTTVTTELTTDDGEVLTTSSGETLLASYQTDETSNFSDTITAYISDSSRYVLSPLDNQIKYIALASPQYCIINYKCLTNQMTMVSAGSLS